MSRKWWFKIYFGSENTPPPIIKWSATNVMDPINMCILGKQFSQIAVGNMVRRYKYCMRVIAQLHQECWNKDIWGVSILLPCNWCYDVIWLVQDDNRYTGSEDDNLVPSSYLTIPLMCAEPLFASLYGCLIKDCIVFIAWCGWKFEGLVHEKNDTPIRCFVKKLIIHSFIHHSFIHSFIHSYIHKSATWSCLLHTYCLLKKNNWNLFDNSSFMFY